MRLRWLVVRARRAPLWLVLAVIGGGLFTVGQAMEVRADNPPQPVLLDGSGDSDILRELVGWQNTLFSSEQPVDFQYFQRGSKDGRGELLAGATDFAFGGVPFTSTELATRPAGAGEIIEVPLTIGSVAIVLTTPAGVGWSTRIQPDCDPDDPDVDPETCKVIEGTFTGPIRIPSENLAAMITGLSESYQGNKLVTWASPTMVAALGESHLVIQAISARHHTFVNRTEGASQNKYLMEYAKELGPTAWALRKEENPQFPWDSIGEVFSPRTISRYGAETQMGLIAIANTDAASNASPDSWTGNMGPVPTTFVGKLISDYPEAGFRLAEVQNANGDFVAPNKESLDLALAAGTSPDVGAYSPVPGAYPLVYVNHLYTVAGTLTAQQANALAASVRYITTDGQQAMVDHGGTTLTPALQAEALAKADEIVVKNCTAAGFEVTTSGPSTYEPAGPGVDSIGTMKHCTPVAAPAPTTTTTTTTTASTTTTTVPDTTTEVSLDSSSTSSSSSLPPDTTPTTTSTTTAPPVVVANVTPPAVPPSPIIPYVAPPSGSSSSGTTPVTVAQAAPLATSATAVAEAVASTDAATTLPPVESSAPVTTAAPLGAGAGTRPRGVSLTDLPLDAPDDGSSGFKKLGTLMLGAAMFVLGRRVVLARSAVG